jgi:TolB-like protein/Flp pilus assembly protein TadD
VNGLRNLVRELHRRSIWQVLAIYVGGAWLVIEVIDHLIERLGLPDWSYGAAWLLLLLGLPMVVATAFVQEASGPATPGGGKADLAGGEHLGGHGRASRPAYGGSALDAPRAGSPGGEPTQRPPFEGGLLGLLTWRNALLGGLAAAALWGVVATAWMVIAADRPGTPPAAELSLAALPFTNLSADEEDLYFTDGIHEEILAQLARIKALRVISRTSVMGYRETDKRLDDIADELGVRYVLEGSVRRFQERVRITAQLIDAETDGHLWADTYDRPREDLFAIQSEVAREIAGALRAELSPQELDVLVRAPTADAEAYDLYLRANDALRGGRTPENLAAAATLYQRAIDRDPEFVAALSRLTYVTLLVRWLGYDGSDARVQTAERLVGRLTALAPEAPETRLARGYLHYYGHYDFDAALPEMEAARDAGVPRADAAYAYILRRLGRWDDHIVALQEAITRDPLDPSPPNDLLLTYAALGRFADATDAGRRAIALAPQFGRPYASLVTTHLAAGDIASAERVLGSVPQLHSNPEAVATAAANVLRLTRRFEEGIRSLESTESRILANQFRTVPVDLVRGRFLELAGRDAEATRAYRSALHVMEARLEERPDDVALLVGLAQTHAALGDTGAMRRAMDRVRAVYPVEADHFSGPEILLDFARAHAWAGETDAALDLIERLLEVPSLLTVARLRLDPDWDGLRDHPRFRALVEASP